MTARIAHSAMQATDGDRAKTGARRTLWFACLAMLVSYLPFSAVNAALGDVARATGAVTGQLQWMSDAFAVALASAVLSAGVLGDLYGRRLVALLGLVLTAVGALLGFLAGGLPSTAAIATLWAGEAVSGLGAGAVMSATLALLSTEPDVARRTRAIAWWAVALVLGLGSGPFITGWATMVATWRWTFVPIVALALLAALYGVCFSGSSAAAEGRGLDLAGQLIGAVTIAGSTFAVIQAGSGGWGFATSVAIGVAGAGLIAFVLVERRAAKPVLELRLFASRGFLASGLAAAVVLFAVGGGAFVLSLVFSRERLDALAIAVRLGFLFAGNALASLAAGRLAPALGPRRIVLGGLVLAGLGSAALLGVGGTGELADVGWRLAVLGAGCGAVMATTSALAVLSVPGALAGMAGAGNNALRQIGAALGPAVLGAVVAPTLHGDDPAVPLHTAALILTSLFLLAAVGVGLLLPRGYGRQARVTDRSTEHEGPHMTTSSTTATVEVSTPFGPVDVSLTDRGAGRPVLLLHGGAGLQSVGPFADRLAAERSLRVLAPTHPGFAGTPRPDALVSIGQLAEVYVALLDILDLSEVEVIGNSIGGWIAAEIALLASPRVASVTLVDAVGIQVPGHPVVDFFNLSLPEIAERSYFDPSNFRIDPDGLPPAARAAMAGNRAALRLYGGEPSMADPSLRERLAGIDLPALVVWGDSDRIADSDYGRAYAAAIPGAAFRLLPETGHLPQLERPDLLLSALAGRNIGVDQRDSRGTTTPVS